MHSECWAHLRRKLYESIPLDSKKQLITTSAGYIGVEFCDKLFKIEREIALLSEEEKLKRRKLESAVVLNNFYDWITTMTKENVIITNDKLRDALIYAKNQRTELSVFLENGKIPLTNNKVERSIRPFAVGRKNWLFADSEAGAEANGIYYSLIESAKINNLKIQEYIKYLLEELSQYENLNDEKKLIKYLPWSKNLPKTLFHQKDEKDEVLKMKDIMA